MRDITRAAEKRLNNHAEAAATQFDSTIMHNRVFEALPQDDQLREYVDVTERAYRLEESTDLPDDVCRTAFSAAEGLNAHISRLVEDVVARECAAALTDMDDWGDAWDDEEIDAAEQEASAWLFEHDDARERNEIDYGAEGVTADA